METKHTEACEGKGKVFCAQVKGKLRGAAWNMAIEFIQTAKRCINKLFDWMLLEYCSMAQESGEATDSSVLDWEYISGAIKTIFVSSNYYKQEGS